MRILFGLLAVSLLCAAPARAQVAVDVQVNMGLPAVLPPMVVVQPGVQVVSGLDAEVFFVNGWYWARRGPNWYRTRDHRRPWVLCEQRRVPVALVRMPPGQYRHSDHRRWQEEHRDWKAEKRAEHATWKAEQRREHEERREEKRERHEHDRDDN